MLLTFTMVIVFKILSEGHLLGGELRAAPLVPGMNRLNNLILLGHILTAIPPLVLGPWQFLPRFRARRMKLHRWMGKVYVICIWISAILGFGLASANHMGYVARAGFMMLAVSWFTTTLLAYTTVRKFDFNAHRRWMLRSYALTLATVTVRFIHEPIGMSLEVWYPIMTWACWVPNLTLAELYIRITDNRGMIKFPARGVASQRGRK